MPIIEYMNDLVAATGQLAGASPESGSAEFPPRREVPEPLERLEARICELAGLSVPVTVVFAV